MAHPPRASGTPRAPGRTRHQQPQAENKLLSHLPAADRESLMPLLDTVRLKRNQVIQPAGDTTPTMYFPTTAMLALVSVSPDGSVTGLGTTGHNGMAAIPLLFGARESPFAMFVQLAGSAQVLRVDPCHNEIGVHRSLDRLLLLYEQTFLRQISQSTVCTSHHTIRGRMASWLLRMRDGGGSDEFSVTEDFLAMMLGVGRLSAAFAVEEFVDDGFIRYRRGAVTVTNGPGLEAVACECYRLVCEEDVRLRALMRVGETWRRSAQVHAQA